jgi:hypothetical protein
VPRVIGTTPPAGAIALVPEAPQATHPAPSVIEASANRTGVIRRIQPTFVARRLEKPVRAPLCCP